MSKTLAPSSQTVTARDPKGLKFVSIVEAAYNKAGLSDDEAQRVNDTSGLADLIAQFIDGNRHENLFEDEEVRSNYKYPKEYKGPKPIATQVDIVAGLYTLSLGNTSEFLNKVLPTLALPQGAEGWFAIPSVDAVAKVHFPEVTDPSERYVRCVLLALEKLKASRPFYNYRDGQITVETLRRHARTAEALRLVTEKQTGDIIVIPAQLGMKHRGRSVRRARALFAGNEFGLGAWEVVNIAPVTSSIRAMAMASRARRASASAAAGSGSSRGGSALLTTTSAPCPVSFRRSDPCSLECLSLLYSLILAFAAKNDRGYPQLWVTPISLLYTCW